MQKCHAIRNCSTQVKSTVQQISIALEYSVLRETTPVIDYNFMRHADRSDGLYLSIRGQLNHQCGTNNY